MPDFARVDGSLLANLSFMRPRTHIESVARNAQHKNVQPVDDTPDEVQSTKQANPNVSCTNTNGQIITIKRQVDVARHRQKQKQEST